MNQPVARRHVLRINSDARMLLLEPLDQLVKRGPGRGDETVPEPDRDDVGVGLAAPAEGEKRGCKENDDEFLDAFEV